MEKKKASHKLERKKLSKSSGQNIHFEAREKENRELYRSWEFFRGS